MTASGYFSTAIKRMDARAQFMLTRLKSELGMAGTGVVRLAIATLYHLMQSGKLEDVLKELRERGYL